MREMLKMQVKRSHETVEVKNQQYDDSSSGEDFAISNKVSTSLKTKILHKMLQKLSTQLNRKKERERFIPADLSELTEPSLVRLSQTELPRKQEEAEFVAVSFLVPVSRQYLHFSNLRLQKSLQTVINNMRVYHRFLNIYAKLKDNVDPYTMNPEKLKRQV